MTEPKLMTAATFAANIADLDAAYDTYDVALIDERIAQLNRTLHRFTQDATLRRGAELDELVIKLSLSPAQPDHRINSPRWLTWRNYWTRHAARTNGKDHS